MCNVSEIYLLLHPRSVFLFGMEAAYCKSWLVSWESAVCAHSNCLTLLALGPHCLSHDSHFLNV